MTSDDRERRVQWLQDHLIPRLDSRLSEAPEDAVDDEHIEKSEQILAEEYYDNARGELKTFAKVLLVLMSVDAFTYMPPQVYGLVFSITGTMIILVYSDIQSSESIAGQSMISKGGRFGGGLTFYEERARRFARSTVFTNIGLVWLALGFLMQIVAVWAVSAGTLIRPIW